MRHGQCQDAARISKGDAPSRVKRRFLQVKTMICTFSPARMSTSNMLSIRSSSEKARASSRITVAGRPCPSKSSAKARRVRTASCSFVPPLNTSKSSRCPLRWSAAICRFSSRTMLEPCSLGHAVQIEPGLWSQSPKNGSFSNVRRRLSAISVQERRKPERGDGWLVRKNPPLAGLLRASGPFRPEAPLAGWGGRNRTWRWRIGIRRSRFSERSCRTLFSLKFIGPSKRWNFENRTESAESRASEIIGLSEKNQPTFPTRTPELKSKIAANTGLNCQHPSHRE
jgi:hypothetical protein